MSPFSRRHCCVPGIHAEVGVAFTGFSTDRLVALPPELFSDVLPAISLPSELKVTLHVFYRLSRQQGNPRRVSWDELSTDQLLRRSLEAIAGLRPADELLAEGLAAAVRRTTLIHLPLPADGRMVSWYLANTAFNQAWARQAGLAGQALAPNQSPVVQRPTLIELYEQNIGLITPLLLEELREAEERFPVEWIAAAIREAVRSNVRSWRYIRKVLERWAVNGRQDAQDRAERSTIDIEKYTDGQLGRLYRRGGDESDL